MRYRLFEKIGSGGMAEVFRAVGEGPEGFERPFVVKQIHPRLSEAGEFVRMFVDEARISARLLHPNIIQVFEFVYQDGCYYMVMEPVDGVDMAHLLRYLMDRKEVPPPALIAEVGRQACRGLEFAHTLTDTNGAPLGIVHRDVTPPNVMVSWNGTVKLLDFGLARAVQELRSSITETGTVKGKMPYLAPELLQGKTADARADVFSLGVVMHELLTGQRLFAGENDLETFKRVLELPVPVPSERNPGIKPVLSSIVLRALERDPARRYQSAREMGDELEAFVLREKYSSRLLAKKLRELLGEQDRPFKLDELPVAQPIDPPIVIGAAESPIFREPSGATRGRSPVAVAVDRAMDSPSAGRSVKPGLSLPPPAPSRVSSSASSSPSVPSSVPSSVPPSVPVARGAEASRGVAGAPRAQEVAAPPRRWPAWVSVAVGTPALLVGALLLMIAVRRPLTVSASPAPVLSPTVTVGIDSTPQGARVGLGDGRVVGHTPVLIDLPRGRSAVGLTLTREGFAPTRFKVIPNHDKDTSVALTRLASERTLGVNAAPAPASAPPASTGQPAEPPSPLPTHLPRRAANKRPAPGGRSLVPFGSQTSTSLLGR